MIRRRPAMYFGNVRAANAWALVSGYVAAERDHGVTSIATARFAGFQPWLDARYPFARGLPWFRVFRLLIGPQTEIERFLEHLDLYLSGAPSDAPDPTMVKMLDAIIRHANELGSSGQESEE